MATLKAALWVTYQMARRSSHGFIFDGLTRRLDAVTPVLYVPGALCGDAPDASHTVGLGKVAAKPHSFQRHSPTMKDFLKRTLPRPVWASLRGTFYGLRAIQYKRLGRPKFTGETTKAHARRAAEGFFDKYCKGHGLDIGHGGDPITSTCDGWDFEDGDAQYLAGARDASYDFVYASHTLEHMVDADIALTNWWRVTKPGGYLLLYVPHRELYEKKRTLPSRFNLDHKHFFMLDRDDPPDTIGLVPLLERVLPDGEIVYAKECSAGHTIVDPNRMSDGEFSIEAVIRRKTPA